MYKLELISYQKPLSLAYGYIFNCNTVRCKLFKIKCIRVYYKLESVGRMFQTKIFDEFIKV